MKYTSQYLQKHVQQTAINEVKELRRTDLLSSFSIMEDHYDKKIKDINLEIINLNQEKDIYDEYIAKIKNELDFILKKLSKLNPTKKELNTYNELHNRINYLRRELLGLQENNEDLTRKIEEMKLSEESYRKFKVMFQERIDLEDNL
jgi:prefoldin subunit 5